VKEALLSRRLRPFTQLYASNQPRNRLAVFGCVSGSVAALLLTLVSPGAHGTTSTTALVAVLITILFVTAESSQIHIELGDQAWSVSLSELPLVLGLFLLPPWWLLLGRLVAAIVVFGLRRTALPKAVFNLGLFLAEVAVAELLFQSMRPDQGLAARDWAVAYFTMLVVGLMSALAVTAGIALQNQRIVGSELARTLPVVALTGAFNTTLALLSLLALHANHAALPLLTALVIVVAIGYRAYHRLQRQHADLGQLFAFTQPVGTAENNDHMLAQLLTEAAELMQAEQSVLLVPRAVATPGSPADGDSLPVGAVVIPRGTRDPMLRSWLTRAGLKDALLVPLHDGDVVVGVLQVGNRIGAMSTFTPEDLRLLQTLTAHAEALWSNARLLELQRHDAHHDSLTGLPNRALFMLRVQEVLAIHPSDAGAALAQAAVMLLDLDRFREVNDTLGHHVGDLLLCQVGARLQTALPPDATVARFGGDEFGVLLPRGVESSTAMDIAAATAASLTQPFQVAGIVLEVSASVGVALIPDDGRLAATVLQHADIAMYAAKRTAVRVARYSSKDDQSSVARLALAGELRRAIDTSQLLVHYQPKLDLASGAVIGFEALARWEHPTRGLLMPDDFVPIAERVGLIGLLTSEILGQALRECRAWLPTHPDEGVAVNLSTRGLHEPHLTANVGRLLAETGVEPRLLTLEITETSVMSDFPTALAALHELRALGLNLSVDDFGTGYSSLAYLMQLPVHEVKIDKSFVSQMAREPAAVAIVRAIIDLSHTLGLTVVAEGVDDTQSLTALTEMGCDTAQGYLLSRPISPRDLHIWQRPVPRPRVQTTGIQAALRRRRAASSRSARG
jgi:diguanylate cyclase (GGDEF)-like protein